MAVFLRRCGYLGARSHDGQKKLGWVLTERLTRRDSNMFLGQIGQMGTKRAGYYENHSPVADLSSLVFKRADIFFCILLFIILVNVRRSFTKEKSETLFNASGFQFVNRNCRAEGSKKKWR